LRYSVRRPRKRDDEFMRRISKAVVLEDAGRLSEAPEQDGWFLGPMARDRGSVHCHLWKETCATLADMDSVVVYPVGGWWKDDSAKRPVNTARYTLIVSVETEAVDVDIWTPVAEAVAVAIPT
jgi:hypothetical protein